jgi:BolA protein
LTDNKQSGLILVHQSRERIIKTFEEILQKLKDYFAGGHVSLENTSSQHVGHNNSGMHLKTTIHFDGFKGKSTMDRHRMVHSVLKEEIGREIHAITIHTSCEE